MSRGPVAAVLEAGREGLSPQTAGLAARARRLAGELGTGVVLLLLGEDPLPLAREAARLTGVNLLAVRVPGLSPQDGEARRIILADLMAELGALAVLASHTPGSMDWAPGLAARLKAAYIPGAEEVRVDREGPVFTRPGHFDKVREDIRPRVPRVVATFSPAPAEKENGGQPEPGKVELLLLEAPRTRIQLVEEEGEEAGPESSLNRARVVVAAGRGIGKPENLELIRRLAALFPGSALGASRPVCDLGWLPYRCQVGLTGQTVAPGLYFACGISGARQHTVGMQGSGFIVAVSQDPGAAIFNLADVCIVEDLLAFIPALLARAEAKA